MVKTLKVEFTVEEDNGQVIIKSLDGEDADRWPKGVQTVKPNSRVKRFLRRMTGRDLTNKEIISVLEKVASELNIPANGVDWAIWELEGAN